MKILKPLLWTTMALGILFLSPIAQAKICNPGDKGEVLWKGKWFPATVINAKSDQCYIHYTGYNDSWNEWVGEDRIRVFKNRSYKKGSKVSVLWKGSWYPAKVKNVSGDKLYVRYDGYSDKYNEWVTPDRYR